MKLVQVTQPAGGRAGVRVQGACSPRGPLCRTTLICRECWATSELKRPWDLVWGQPRCLALLSESLLRRQKPGRATSERLPKPAHSPSDTLLTRRHGLRQALPGGNACAPHK